MRNFEDSILRVLQGDAIVGAGFLVSEHLVVTCAHVIQSAGVKVGGQITLRLRDGRTITALVEPEFWREPNSNDISILRLQEPLTKIQPLILGSSSGTKGHQFSTFGFPKQGQELSGGGEIIGQANLDGIKVLQLRSPEVTPGFSGAPIFDEMTKRVVGLVVAIIPPDDYQRLGTTAFAVPSEVIHEVSPALRIDRSDELLLNKIRFFVTLQDYLNRPTSEFPTEKDFENDLVYFPGDYLNKVDGLLENQNKCLLVGNPAAGKTVLAIAFARKLQEERGFRVFYSNVGRALDGDGRRWYSVIANNDTENTLFILDDCHLSSDEVNDFSFQLDGNPPRYAWVLLIARTSTRAKQVDTTIGDFYELFTGSKLIIQSENIYMGILAQYANSFRKLNDSYYFPLEIDEKSILERDHSHSLVLSKSRLNTWRKVGGKLSEVSDDIVYNTLADTYLTKARSSMVSLCGLWQLEVPLHATYVENAFSHDELQYLIAVNIITYDVFSKYGKMYYPLIHSEEAKAIFEAGIILKWGSLNEVSFRKELTNLLFSYLASHPQNYQTVYDQLYQHGYEEIEQQLLSDDKLQEAALTSFYSGRLTDVARYLFGLTRNQREKAQQLLSTFVTEYDISTLRREFYKQNLHNLQFSLHYFHRSDRDWTINFFTELDTNLIIQIIEKDTFYNLSWFINTAAKISQDKTSEILNTMPLSSLADLARQSTIGNLQRFITHCRRFNVRDKTWIKQLVDMLIDDIPVLLESTTYDDIKKFRREVHWIYEGDKMKIRKIYNQTTFDEPNQTALMLFHTGWTSSPYFFLKASKNTDTVVSIFIEKFFTLKLSKSNPRDFAIFLSILKQKESPYYSLLLNKTLEYMFNSSYIYQFLKGNINDLIAIINIFEWGLSEEKFNREVVKSFIDQINAQEMSLDTSKVSPDFLILFIWKVVSIGNIEKIVFFSRSILLIMVDSLYRTQATWSLELIGILTTTDSSYCNEPVIRNLELSKPICDRILVWLRQAAKNNTMHVHFLLVLKGLRCVDQSIAAKFIIELIEVSNMVNWIDELLDSTNKITLHKLVRETRLWISEIVFQDTIDSIDNLSVIISNSQMNNNDTSI